MHTRTRRALRCALATGGLVLLGATGAQAQEHGLLGEDTTVAAEAVVTVEADPAGTEGLVEDVVDTVVDTVVDGTDSTAVAAEPDAHVDADSSGVDADLDAEVAVGTSGNTVTETATEIVEDATDTSTSATEAEVAAEADAEAATTDPVVEVDSAAIVHTGPVTGTANGGGDNTDPAGSDPVPTAVVEADADATVDGTTAEADADATVGGGSVADAEADVTVARDRQPAEAPAQEPVEGPADEQPANDGAGRLLPEDTLLETHLDTGAEVGEPVGVETVDRVELLPDGKPGAAADVCLDAVVGGSLDGRCGPQADPGDGPVGIGTDSGVVLDPGVIGPVEVEVCAEVVVSGGIAGHCSEEGPQGPTDPTGPKDPVDPTEPKNPTEPTDPAGLAGTVDPKDPTDPKGPTDTSGPATAGSDGRGDQGASRGDGRGSPSVPQVSAGLAGGGTGAGGQAAGDGEATPAVRGELAQTGADAGLLAGLALVLMSLGGLLLGLRRRLNG